MIASGNIESTDKFDFSKYKKTSLEWWEKTKSSNENLNKWLSRQYGGEIAAVNMMSEMLLRFGSELSKQDWKDLWNIMRQEATHALWIKELLDARGISPEHDPVHDKRYWAEVLPNIKNSTDAFEAAFHAENMRLDRIAVIAFDDSAPVDIVNVFKKILVHESWHETFFNKMRNNSEKMSKYHERGLDALNLILT